MDSKVITIIFTNTYTDSCGCEFEVFGVADNNEDAEKICEKVKEQGFKVQTIDIPLNEYNRIYLGGYVE